jgi:hypothetical protein
MHDRLCDATRFARCPQEADDDLAPARGIVLGLIAAGVMWTFAGMCVALWVRWS